MTEQEKKVLKFIEDNPHQTLGGIGEGVYFHAHRSRQGSALSVARPVKALMVSGLIEESRPAPAVQYRITVQGRKALRAQP